MPTRPTAVDLLEALEGFLRENLPPSLEDPYQKYQLRVAANVTAIVKRELELSPKARREEQARVEKLLGKSGELDELNRALAAAIRAGEMDSKKEALMEHLQKTLENALKINNPRWL